MNPHRFLPTAILFVLTSADAAHGEDFVRVEARRNLLAHSSFEAAADSRRPRPEGWFFDRPGEEAVAWDFVHADDPAEARSGRRSVRMGNFYTRGLWQERTYVMSDRTPLDSSKKHVGRVWYRTRGVRHGRVLVRVSFFSGWGMEIRAASRLMRIDAAPVWTAYDFPFEPPREAKSFVLKVTLEHSPGTLWIDDAGVWELTEAEWRTLHPFGRYRAPEIRTRGERPAFPAAPTVTVRQDEEGVWWLVRADGTPFYYVATHVGIEGNEPFKAYVRTSLGMTVEEHRARATFLAGHDLGFNANYSPAVGGERVNFIEWLEFSNDRYLPGTDWVLKDRDGETFGTRRHYFPDPWSAAWRAFVKSEAENIEPWHLKSPEVIGYFTDNEWAYGEMSEYFWSEAARRAFVDWLQGRLAVPPGYEKEEPYRTVVELNRAWSSRYHTYAYSAFEDVYGADKPRIRTFDDPVAGDLHAFERVVMKTYVDTVVGAIRRREEHLIAEMAERGEQGYPKLVFSCRISWEGPDSGDDFFRRNGDILAAFDVVAVNAYPGMRFLADHQSRSHMEALRELFVETTGRPVLISEFGVAARDAGVGVKRWRPRTVDTQAQRGEAYRNLSATWANSPWIVGQTWYRWANGHGKPTGSDPRNSGLVDDRGSYYTDLTERMIATHRELRKIRRRGGFGAASVDWRPLTYPVYESAPPELRIVEPDGDGDETAERYTVTWEASDIDGEATVTLYASTEAATASNAVAIASGLPAGTADSLEWDVSGLLPGRYFVVGAVHDGTGPPRWATSSGAVVVKAPQR